MKVIALFLVLFSSSLFAKGMVLYSESADVFEIMDQVSRWHPAHRPEYREEWVRRFGKLGNDLNMLGDYADLRKKYHKTGPAVEDSLFVGKELRPDFFSMAFYKSRSVGEALKKLSKRLSKKEIDFLKAFYNHFKSNISQMVKESTQFKSQAKTLNKKLKKAKVSSLLNKAQKFFYNKKRRAKPIFLFTWWPASKEPIVESRGNYFLLRFNPIEHSGNIFVEDLMVVVMEGLMMEQGQNQKQNLSKIFNGKCQTPKGVEAGHLLQYPLAIVWGKMMLLKNKNKKNFTLYQEWSPSPWVNSYAKMIFPLVEEAVRRRETISGGFIGAAGLLCQELVVLGNYLASFK